MENIIYHKELPEYLIPQATELYAEAFEQKFLNIIGDKEIVADLFQNNARCDRAIAASSGDKLLGIAGLNYDKTPFIHVQLEDFQEKFGFVKGSVKAVVSDYLFSKKPAEDELLVDGIVVSSDSRGKGIGSNLFKLILEFAQEKDLRKIVLDVIDENPRAKKLYEKLGFETIKHENIAYLKSLIGISGVSTMVKEL